MHAALTGVPCQLSRVSRTVALHMIMWYRRAGQVLWRRWLVTDCQPRHQNTGSRTHYGRLLRLYWGNLRPGAADSGCHTSYTLFGLALRAESMLWAHRLKGFVTFGAAHFDFAAHPVSLPLYLSTSS